MKWNDLWFGLGIFHSLLFFQQPYPVHWACPFQLTSMKHCVSEVFHEPVLVWLQSSKNKRISKLQKSQASKLKNRKVCFCSFCVFMEWRNSVLREWLWAIFAHLSKYWTNPSKFFRLVLVVSMSQATPIPLSFKVEPCGPYSSKYLSNTSETIANWQNQNNMASLRM